MKKIGLNHYDIVLSSDWNTVNAEEWNALLAQQSEPTPFMQHAYLAALQASQSACIETGWQVTVWQLYLGGKLHAACALYLKNHSMGEYVFDWAWAEAYQRHHIPYYPKALVAVPFTPVPGSRLLAVDSASRQALLSLLLDWCKAQDLSSLHLLFLAEEEHQLCQHHALLARPSVQFHWHNQGYADWPAFLQNLSHDKRKKIKQEMRKVQSAGVQFTIKEGRDTSSHDWDFFYTCYARTYQEHGTTPYLTRAFFHAMQQSMAPYWVLFLAMQNHSPIACSLIAIDAERTIAYGRYWGALQRVDCLHFATCYYQPLQWCIAQGVQRFEGGAQGEHKMARALLPATTRSAHWLAHPAFAQAVTRYVDHENSMVENYMEELNARSPMRHGPPQDMLTDQKPS